MKPLWYNSSTALKLNQFSLNIADFSIKLYSESEIDLEEGYLSFLSNTQNHDTTIECFSDINSPIFENKNLVFEAANEIQKFYSIYKFKTDLGFVIYNQQNINEVQQTAILSKNFKHWQIFAKPDEKGNLNPLRYPMGPIIMQYLTVKSEAVMIHASCVFDGEKGRIFTGFSGTGKSTISQIWSEAGNQVINDDRLIIRKTDTGYFVYNTPMYYRDSPKKAPLNSIFLISHYPENKIKKLTGAIAVSKVLAFCIQNNFDRFFIQNNLDFLTALSTQIAVYELGFVPNSSVVDYVLSNETV